jgi:hypothetical protein
LGCSLLQKRLLLLLLLFSKFHSGMSSPFEEEVFLLASTYLDDAINCRNVNFVPEREETR